MKRHRVLAEGLFTIIIGISLILLSFIGFIIHYNAIATLYDQYGVNKSMIDSTNNMSDVDKALLYSAIEDTMSTTIKNSNQNKQRSLVDSIMLSLYFNRYFFLILGVSLIIYGLIIRYVMKHRYIATSDYNDMSQSKAISLLLATFCLTSIVLSLRAHICIVNSPYNINEILQLFLPLFNKSIGIQNRVNIIYMTNHEGLFIYSLVVLAISIIYYLLCKKQEQI